VRHGDISRDEGCGDERGGNERCDDDISRDEGGLPAVIASHLDAVRSGDPVAMADGYHPDAQLIRPDATHVGIDAIRAYFAGVPQRLGPGRVEFISARADFDGAVVVWRIDGGPVGGTSGSDEYRLEDRGGGPLIIEQTVRLDTPDF